MASHRRSLLTLSLLVLFALDSSSYSGCNSGLHFAQAKEESRTNKRPKHSEEPRVVTDFVNLGPVSYRIPSDKEELKQMKRFFAGTEYNPIKFLQTASKFIELNFDKQKERMEQGKMPPGIPMESYIIVNRPGEDGETVLEDEDTVRVMSFQYKRPAWNETVSEKFSEGIRRWLKQEQVMSALVVMEADLVSHDMKLRMKRDRQEGMSQEERDEDDRQEDLKAQQEKEEKEMKLTKLMAEKVAKGEDVEALEKILSGEEPITKASGKKELALYGILYRNDEIKEGDRAGEFRAAVHHFRRVIKAGRELEETSFIGWEDVWIDTDDDQVNHEIIFRVDAAFGQHFEQEIEMANQFIREHGKEAVTKEALRNDKYYNDHDGEL